MTTLALALFAASLQAMVDDASGTLSLSEDAEISASVEVTKSLKIIGNGHSVKAAEGFAGPLLRVCGDDIYVQLQNLSLEGETCVDATQGNAALCLLNCTVSANDCAIVYDCGGSGIGRSYTDPAFPELPSRKDLAVLNCALSGETGILLQGSAQVLLGMTSVSAKKTVLSVASTALGGDVLFVGTTDAQKSFPLSAPNAVASEASGTRFWFYNAELAGEEFAVFLGNGASANSFTFRGDYGKLAGAFCMNRASALAEISAEGQVSVSDSQYLLNFTPVSPRKDYSVAAETVKSPQNITGVSALVAPVLPYAIGSVEYATFAEAKSALESSPENLRLTIRMDGSVPVVELCKTNELDGLRIAIHCDERLDGSFANEWHGEAPSQMFFRAEVVEAE